MKVLENYEDLVGKTISFSHMAQFADKITLATTDGELLMATFDYVDDEEFNVRVLDERRVVSHIQRDSFLQKQLGAIGVFDTAAYEKERQERMAKERERHLIATEKRERQQLAELKLKYPDAAQ